MSLQKNPQTPLTSSPMQNEVPAETAQKTAAVKKPVAKSSGGASTPFWAGLGISIAWVTFVAVVVSKASIAQSFGGVSLIDWAVGISAAVSPVAMVWMITAYLQRAADIKSITDPLRRQLTLITGESGAADARIRRFNQAIREQIELLRNAQVISQEDMEAIMDRVQQHRAELERFESVSAQQVKEIQDVVRQSMYQIEQMMDDKFTMLRVLDGKLQENGETVSQQVGTVAEQVSRMLEQVEQSSGQIADALDRAQRDSQKLSDTSRLQEASMVNAAEAAAETLGGLSSKIDLSVSQFLERASSAREESERLAQALDAQTRTLDDFTATLPMRVTEAESILRGVADRLYASEQLASEQAVNLSERLSQQIDGLQNFMNGFTDQLGKVGEGLENRQGDLKTLADRINTTSAGFFTAWEKSIDDLNDRMGNSLLRFTVVNDETRRNADLVAGHLNETTDKYEDAVKRMQALSSEGGERMKGLTEDITAHLAQFEKLNAASVTAGEEVQARAANATQNLQQVLDRVLAARDATQTIGQSLVKEISDAVGQNEKLMQRLNETAQLGARAIGTAAENLGRQEGEILGKARASEAVLMESMQKLRQQAETTGKGLREQTMGLMSLLTEAQSQMAATDRKLQSFAEQAVTPVQKAVERLDASADQGLKTLGTFGEGLSSQVERLQGFHARIGTMSQEMSKATAESAGAFESLAVRYAKIRAEQESAAQATIAQFSEVSERLQREVGHLDDRAAQAIEILQQAATTVGEQSGHVAQKAEMSSEQIKQVSASLQAEAAHIQEALQRQADDVGASLARAEEKFAVLGDVIREKAAETHVLLDRTASRYVDVTDKLGQTVDMAQGKVEALHTALADQAERISSDALKVEKGANEISMSSSRAVEHLSMLKERISATHDAAAVQGQQTLEKLGEVTAAFQNSTSVVAEAAQKASDTVLKAGDAFDIEAAKLVEDGQQISAVLNEMTQATNALSEKEAAIRLNMEQQNSRLLMQLSDSITQLDMTNTQLQRVIASATQGADQASARFAEMTDTAGQRIDGAAQDLFAKADHMEKALSTLGTNVTQQAATLSVVGEQLGEQQRILAEASEKQRAQMLELFDRLNTAHAQASEVTERSIVTLTRSLKEIDSQIGNVNDKAQTTIGNVKVASMGFSDQSNMLIQNAQAAEQQARAVLQATESLQEQAKQLKAGLQAESERAGESLSALLGRLTAGGTEVRELGANTNTVLSALQRALSEQTADMNASMDKIGERQRTLTAALDGQREAINSLLSRLSAAQDQTAIAAERVVTRLAEGSQQIMQSVENIDSRAQDALNNVQKTAAGFAYETENIGKQAGQTVEDVQKVLASATEMREKIDSLRQSMREEGESANVVLGALLDKVKDGAEGLREVGEATEMSLTSLNDNVAQKSAALKDSLSGINERQASLLSALDAQREMVDGLLSRFKQAQEETVTTAERAASRLNEEAQSITTSIDMIGAQASTTLSSVQTAAKGFAEQAVEIRQQSQQAEEQVRGVMSVTTGMQEQSKQLREAMQAETGRVVELLSGVIEKLDTAGRQLKTESTDTAKELDQTAQRLSSVIQVGTDLLRTQTQAVNQAVDESETRLTQANEKVTSQMKLVTEAGAAADEKTQQLANAAEFAAKRLITLRETLAETDKSGREIAVSTFERGEEVKASLQSQLKEMTETSQKATGEVAAAASALSAQTEALRANLAASESAMTQAADFVREEAKQLPAALGRSMSDIETAAKALKTQTVETDQTMIGTADRFISVTARARDNLAEEMKHISAMAEDAGKILDGFNQLLAEQVASMRQNTAMLSGEQQDLVEKASHGINSLAEASQRLSALRSEATSTAERLVQEFDILDQRAAVTSGRLAQAGSSIAKQVEAITSVASGAESSLTSVSDTLRQQLDAIRGGLQGQIEEVNRGLLQITAQLERTGASLRSTTVGAVADVERVGKRFEETGTSAAAQVTAETDRLRAATEAVDGVLAGFSEKFDQMIDHMAQAGADIKYQEGTAIEHLQRMLAHLGMVAEKLESARSLSGNVSQKAIEQLDEVVTAVQAQMSKLTSSSQTAAGIMRGIGQIYSDQTSSLSKGVGEAHTQVLNMNKSIDDMQQRADRMRTALRLQSEDLMNSLSQILGQLETSGDGLTDAVNKTLSEQVAAKRIM